MSFKAVTADEERESFFEVPANSVHEVRHDAQTVTMAIHVVRPTTVSSAAASAARSCATVDSLVER